LIQLVISEHQNMAMISVVLDLMKEVLPELVVIVIIP